MLDVFFEELAELALVPDDGSVEEFVTECPDPSFGVCVCLRRAWWCSDCGDAGSGEDGVEGPGELSGAVSDQELERMTFAEAAHQVSGGLGGPRSGRVGRDPREMSSSCGDLDDEQNVESALKRGVDTCEVGGEDCFGLGSDEL